MSVPQQSDAPVKLEENKNKSQSRSCSRSRSASRSRSRSPSRRKSNDHRSRSRSPSRSISPSRLSKEQLKERSTTLFVGNVPYNFQERDIEQLFAPFGNISELALPFDHRENHNKG